MAVRTIITYGHAGLTRRATPVEAIDEAIRALVSDLFETMHAARGIGLAATQVAEEVRVAVLDPQATGETGARAVALINPEIREYSGSEMFEEGCLSVPGIYAEVNRPGRVLVRYEDLEGRERVEEFEGVMARVAQHEIDHLEGRLFIDRLSRMRRALLARRLKELEGNTRAGTPLL